MLTWKKGTPNSKTVPSILFLPIFELAKFQALIWGTICSGYFGRSSNCLDWCFGGEWFGILTCPRKYGPHKGWLTTVGPKGFMISSNLGTKNTQGRAIHYNIHVSLRWIFPFFCEYRYPRVIWYIYIFDMNQKHSKGQEDFSQSLSLE